MTNMNKEEWQSTDSNYLNCIGLGGTYIKKMIAHILNDNIINAKSIMWDPNEHNPQIGTDVWVHDLKFKHKDR